MMGAVGQALDGPFTFAALVVQRLGLPQSWADRYIDLSMSVLVAALLTISSFFVWRRIRKAEGRLLPDERITLTNLIELTIGALNKLASDVMGSKRARVHMPLIVPLFIYLIASNLIGVLPGLSPPTENINTNLACALVVFLYYNVWGIRKQGVRRYFRHMAGPMIWLAPLLFAIEIVSHIVRPISLSVRLLGNIAGDHMVLEIFSDMVPLFLPIVFMALAIFISILQAFVFTLLAIIYIEMASPRAEA